MVKVWLFGSFADCALKSFEAQSYEELKQKVNEFISNSNCRWKDWRIAKEFEKWSLEN